MNEEKDYNPEGCLSLASEAIQRCFTIPVYGDTYEQRIEFANSKMIELFCDCTTNFDASKLRKQIISFNSK